MPLRDLTLLRWSRASGVAGSRTIEGFDPLFPGKYYSAAGVLVLDYTGLAGSWVFEFVVAGLWNAFRVYAFF